MKNFLRNAVTVLNLASLYMAALNMFLGKLELAICSMLLAIYFLIMYAVFYRE